MTLIRDILEKKGSQVYSVDLNETAHAAAEKMVEHGVGSLLVMDGDQICGIITGRAYLRDSALKDRSAQSTVVTDISTCDGVAIHPGYTVEAAMAIMTERHIRHLPVLEKDQLAGLVSIGDLVKQVSKQHQAEIHYLTEYLTGKYPA